MTRTLIAGGAGFIGCHLVESLLLHGHEVWVIDNLSTGSTENLNHVLENPNFHLIVGDIQNNFRVAPRFDLVIHMACMANPTDYQADPLSTLKVNSDGTQNLLHVAERDGARFIYFSSSEVYGNYRSIPKDGLTEEGESNLHLGNMRSAYPVGKCFGEELVRAYSIDRGTEHVIIRPFNVYGDRMDRKSSYGRVIQNFIRNALEKKPLEINGDGSQTRSFLFIDDFIDCLIRIIDNDKLKNITMNIGSPEPVKILDLAALVNTLLSNKAGCIFKPRFPFEPDNRHADIHCVKDILGWYPRTTLNDGIIRTSNYLRNISKLNDEGQNKIISSDFEIYLYSG